MRRCFLLLATLGILWSLTPTLSAHTVSPDEWTLLRWTNSYRSRVPVAALTMNHRLSEYARTQSYQMAKYREVFHSSWTRLRTAAGDSYPGWRFVGENVGRCVRLYDCYLAFYKSPEHRANMGDPHYRYAGLGVVEAAGSYYVTEMFVG